MPRLILFDIDGTLLSAGGASKRAFEQAFNELFGLPESWGTLDARGQTDPALLALVAERVLGRTLLYHEIDNFRERFVFLFEHEVRATPHFRVYAGVRELCQSLSEDDDLILGLQTGNLEECAWLKLKRAGIDHYFECGGFGSDHHDRTELVRSAIDKAQAHIGDTFRPEDILVIGDTPRDARAANALGVPVLLVQTSGYSEEELAAFNPIRVLKDFSAVEETARLIRRGR